jgi:hypothetical protein
LFFAETFRFHCPLPLGGLYSLSGTIRGGHLTTYVQLVNFGDTEQPPPS